MRRIIVSKAIFLLTRFLKAQVSRRALWIIPRFLSANGHTEPSESTTVLSIVAPTKNFYQKTELLNLLLKDHVAAFNLLPKIACKSISGPGGLDVRFRWRTN